MLEKLTKIAVFLDFIVVGFTISEYRYGIEIPICQIVEAVACLLFGVSCLAHMKVGTTAEK